MTGPVARRYSDVFVALDAAGVRYVIVGGVAVNFYGFPRLTVDLDLVLDLRPDVAERAIDTLVALGFETRLPVDPRQFADAAIRADWVDNRNMQVFSLHDPQDPLREIDLFVKDPIPFEALVDASQSVAVGGVFVRIASREHMIAMKRAAGRPRDLEDIAMLEPGL